MKNQSFKSGEAVVYDTADGGSVSATVVNVGLTSSRRYAILRFAVPVNRDQHAVVYERDWDRLTKFGNNLFLATT